MKKLTKKQKNTLEGWIRESKKKQEVLRAQAVLLLDETSDQEKLLRFTGYSRAQVFRLKKKFLDKGVESLEDRRKERPKELLTRKQRNEIIETVKTKVPKNLGTYYRNYDHWTTGVLGHWIEEAYEVKYKSKTSLYLVFKKAVFTYHKPGRVYDKHDEAEVTAWRRGAKPKLKRYWREQDTVVLTADEMILTTETTIQKVWFPEGEFPKIVITTGGRKRRNVYGFLNVKTGQEHAWKTELQNMYTTRDILKEIRKIYPTQRIVLFWDNAGWHKGSVAQEYLKEDGNIVQIPFPTYAPDENPQEHVWREGRSAVTRNRYIEDIDTATDELVKHFNETRFPYSLLGFRLIS